jgi:uracil-DNA glycosylase family 4
MKAWNTLHRDVVGCELCPRLREHCQNIAQVKRRSFSEWTYWGKPVPNLGEPPAPLLIVGLAPAAHGGNRTGRIFTGDASGDWLYRALHKAGFCNQPTSTSMDDGLELTDCIITAVGHCAPPDNKPTKEELEMCRPFLQRTIEIGQPKVLVALGQIAWKELIVELRRSQSLVGRTPQFKHGAVVPLADGRWLVGSYHPSQRNTFTGLLTEPMFDAIFREAKRLIRKKSVVD